jgi:hypothetical protein
MMATIEVKIAVAVDRNGNWCSAGWKDAGDKEKRDSAAEYVEPGERIYWLTARVEVPGTEPEIEVPADVTPAQ